MNPMLWAAIIFVFSQAIALYMAVQQKAYFEAAQIELPQYTAGPALIYFFATVVVFGLVLYLVRHWGLKTALRVLFTLMFSWGALNVSSFFLPLIPAAIIGVGAGLFWVLRPTIWLHNILLSLTAASAAVSFGFLFAPWTVVLVTLVISLYDVLAVRFGYMTWMAERLSQSETLPAFFIPRESSSWNLPLKGTRLEKLTEVGPEKREFGVLGGGDIIFPLVMVVSVFKNYGLPGGIVVGAFSLLGLGGAYLSQRIIFKGKPTPALPPIALAAIAGLLVVHYELLSFWVIGLLGSLSLLGS